ncbi:MAG: 3-keto-disaccharide hydrolase [Fimbriimonas sp.]
MVALTSVAALAVSTALVARTQDQTAVALNVSGKAPAGAVVLLDGSPDAAAKNFYKRYTKQPSGWKLGKEGYSNDKVDITSRQEFGDAYLHAEWRTPLTGDGNAGIAFQGRYEIQIFDNFGTTADKHGVAALYDQTPAKINASKKRGEWQTFDIYFRAPRFDAAGKVTEPARATVIHNGVVVHNNASFTGPTGIQYGEYKGEAPLGPIVLQGDHGNVEFRNVWVLPL